MCPRLPHTGSQPPPAVSHRIQRAAWIATARCTIAAFHQHSVNHNILCDNCYLTQLPRRRNRYELVIRHYITLGESSLHERCAACSRVLVATTPVHEATCGQCPGILTDFLSYLTRHGLTPFRDPEPTHVVIRQFRA